MTVRLDASTYSFLTTMKAIDRAVEKVQQQVTSGLRVNTASDSPDDLSSLMQLRTELSQITQVASNLDRVSTEVDTAEQVLQSAVEIMERAAVLGTQGANGTMDADDRQILTEEVEALLEEMVGISRTKVEAKYVFSGNSDSTAPFELDWEQDDPVGAYQGSEATKEVMHPAGTKFEIALSGEEIFDNADSSKNVFDALNNLRIALDENDQTAIEDALAQVQTASVHLNQELAFYGTVQNRIAEAQDYASGQELRLEERISEIEDTDMTEGILALTQGQYQQEVALNVQSKIQQTSSLFDYLG